MREEGVVEDVHDGERGPVGVGEELVVGGHGVGGGVSLRGCFGVQPLQKFQVLLVSFKGIEDVGLLT